LLGWNSGCGFGDAKIELRFFVAELGLEDLAGAGDGVALVVEEGFDAENHLDVAAAVEALAGSAFVGLELGEFTLPEAEDIGRQVAEFGDFADTEVELIRDFRPG
jgi:hypothetical protein